MYSDIARRLADAQTHKKKATLPQMALRDTAFPPKDSGTRGAGDYSLFNDRDAR
jgi:hypothetical protein